MWNTAKARSGLALMSEALSLLDEIGEGTLAAHLSLVVELLEERIETVAGPQR